MIIIHNLCLWRDFRTKSTWTTSLPLPPASAAPPDWPGWSAKISTNNLFDPFLYWSTTVSFNGSLFFSNQPVMLYVTCTKQTITSFQAIFYRGHAWRVQIAQRTPPGCGRGRVTNTHHTGVMGESEVSLLATGFGRGRFPEVGRFTQMVGGQLVLERLVRGFREHRFFFENRQDTHRL